MERHCENSELTVQKLEENVCPAHDQHDLESRICTSWYQFIKDKHLIEKQG